VDDGVFIPLLRVLEFPCGTNKVVPEFGSDFFWLVAPLFPPFPSSSYDLLLIIDF
jgi:hypothetical protein